MLRRFSSRTARLSSGIRLKKLQNAQQRRSGNPIEELAVRERHVEIPPRDACVLARNRVRARSLAVSDRLDERMVLVLGHEQDLPRLGERRVHHQERAGRCERQREGVPERAIELRALGERSEPAVELLVEAEVLHERLDAVRAHGRVQASAAVAQGLELRLRLEPLRSQPCRSPLQHAPELDCIVDVGARELAHDEAPARKRLEQPLVLERHQGDAERCPRDAELLHEPELGDALARLEGAVEE